MLILFFNFLVVKKRVALIKCMIPSSQFPDETLMDLIVWMMAKIDTIPSSLIIHGFNLLAGLFIFLLKNSTIFNKLDKTTFNIASFFICFQIFFIPTGLWQYELVNQKTMSMYYDCFFLKLMTTQYVRFFSIKKLQQNQSVKILVFENLKNLEIVLFQVTHLSRLIFLITKPDNVRRREVLRILRLQTQYEPNKPEWNRLNAVLLIFKTYKPDLVPENVKAINCERAWIPIPEDLETHLSAARERMTTHPDSFDCFSTNLTV